MEKGPFHPQAGNFKVITNGISRSNTSKAGAIFWKEALTHTMAVVVTGTHSPHRGFLAQFG